MTKKITIAHGSGGKITNELIKDMFFKYFKNDILDKCDDAAVVGVSGDKIAFTTDSFVVKPVFFPGGDIGKIAVCGTVNDLAVSGAEAKYISCGFIIEEGFPEKDLEKIVRSIAGWALKAGVFVVTGDTKVVGSGEADNIFINTSGVGIFKKDHNIGAGKIKPGDKIIINGTIGDHGMAVLSRRKGLEFESVITSDCAPLNRMIADILAEAGGVKFMRDPTRGGLATTLNEITNSSNFGVIIEEEHVPIREEVRAACELLGLDPLYVANEGKVIIIADPDHENAVLDIVKENEYGSDACTIGEVTEENSGKVCLKTRYSVTRIIDMLSGEQLPRIC